MRKEVTREWPRSAGKEATSLHTAEKAVDLVVYDDLVPTLPHPSQVLWKLIQEAEQRIHDSICLPVPKYFMGFDPAREGSDICITRTGRFRMENVIKLEARSVHEAKGMLHSSDKHDMLVINPVKDYNQDFHRMEGDVSLKAYPTVQFEIRWQGAGESFVRRVDGLKELYDVLKPIFSEHVRARDLLVSARKKNEREARKAQIKDARRNLKQTQNLVKHAEQRLEEAEDRARG